MRLRLSLLALTLTTLLTGLALLPGLRLCGLRFSTLALLPALSLVLAGRLLALLTSLTLLIRLCLFLLAIVRL